MKDLFGVEVPDVEIPRGNESGYQLFKRQNHYRLSESKTERCKFCKFHVVSSWGSRNYHKCHLIGASACSATDIAIRNICDKFEKEKDENS